MDVAVTFMSASNSLNFDYIPISTLASDNLANIAPTSSGLQTFRTAVRGNSSQLGTEHHREVFS